MVFLGKSSFPHQEKDEKTAGKTALVDALRAL